MEEEKEMMNINSSPQKDVQMSRNGSNYGGKNGHVIMSSGSQLPFNNGHSHTPSTLLEDHPRSPPFRKVAAVRYKECLKNHAAAIGGNATDGCGEFMPSGEEGTIEALKCSACNCHRNFHRKEIDGGSSGSGGGDHQCLYDYSHHHSPFPGNGLFLGPPPQAVYPINSLVSSRTAPPPSHHPMIVSYKSGSLPSESDEKDDENNGNGIGFMSIRPVDQKLKKRFRTKFTEEQKEKMLNFAEKAGWKMQKLEESAVQRFCQEVGIKRKVLKVWMHNNKHNFAKKINSTSIS